MSTTLKSGDIDRQAQLERVAETTLLWPYKIWGFGEGIALRGLQAAARATGNSENSDFANALLRSYVVRGVAKGNDEHIAPGAQLLSLYEESGEPDLLIAAKKLAALHASFPKNEYGARMHRPDLPGWRKQIWVDCMDVDAPFLVRLGNVTGNDAFIEQGTEEIFGYARSLQVETGGDNEGLFWHGREEDCGQNGQLWARGNGWALMGLVETLIQLPAGHDARAELSERLAALCQALSRCQDSGGLWHTVMPNPETYLESTLAVMTAFALRSAFESSVLRERDWGGMEKSARSAAHKLVNGRGELERVSDATPIGEEKMYATRPFGVFPWGQGPALLMLAQELP